LAEFHNPQGGADNDSGSSLKSLLPMAFAFFVILVAMQWFAPKQSNKPTAPQQSQQQTTQTTPTAQAAIAPPAAASVQQASSESETVIENDLFRVVFTNRGAQVKSWLLKKYTDRDGRPLDLVNPHAAPMYGYPLSMWSPDEALQKTLNSALYKVSATGKLSTPATLSFDYSDGSLVVRKSFSFGADYVLKVETSVTRNGAYQAALPSWPSGFGDLASASRYAKYEFLLNNGGKAQRLTPGGLIGKSDVEDGRMHSSPVIWGGVDDQYFAAVFMPDEPTKATAAQIFKWTGAKKDPKDPKSQDVTYRVVGAAVGAMYAPVSERMFVGPKVLDMVTGLHANSMDGRSGAGPDLGKLVNLGFFEFFAKPLFYTLRWIEQNVFHNWGWSIIALTVIISLCLFPLRYKQMVSALHMQKIAPQLKALQKKYEGIPFNDPRKQEQQKEQSELMKSHGVNPLAGCLPTLATLPFLWAFYQMLSSTIELRHASWLWIKDLSASDPYYILVIVIGALAVGLQRMTPMGGVSDEQRRMMNVMMPVMMVMFFMITPAGLSLYMVTSYSFNVGQQYYMNHTTLGREIRETQARQAAKRKKR